MKQRLIQFFSTCLVAMLMMSPLHAEESHEMTELLPSTQYTCPMHPHYIAESEGSCPICGMDLVPLETEASHSIESTDQVRKITISPETIQNMGVRIKPAELVRFGKEIRAYGLVDVDTRLQTVMTGRVEGWLEDLKIRAIGDQVYKGMPLFKLYSPELIAAQRDFLNALKGRNKQRIRSAEQRLRSTGVNDKVLTKLRKDRKIIEKVTFYANGNGLVSELLVQEGSYIKPSTLITKIQSYDRVWLNASVPEKDLSLLSVGGDAVITFPNRPGHSLNSKINYIYPEVDKNSRTGTVRLVLQNKDKSLRPGTYADVVFHVDENHRLAVADESILMNADGAHLVIAMGEGRFESRKIKTGLSSGGYTEITQGIDENESVVISGQFLIDSESSLRESFTKLKRLQTPYKLLDLNSSEMAMVDHLIDAALYMHEAMVDGYDVEQQMLQASRDIKAPLLTKFKGTQLEFLIDDADVSLVAAMKARSESELFDALNGLVNTLKPWILNGKPEHYFDKNVFIYKDLSSDRLWLQLDQEIYNPYQEDAEADMLHYPANLTEKLEG